MTRRRAKTPEGQFIGDDPSTPDVNEAWIEEETTELLESSEASTEEVPLESQTDVNPSDPATVVIVTSPEAKIKDAQSAEAIGAAMQDKLSKRDDSLDSNPFVPSIQLEKEVKEIARREGFPLSRGTEVGARLIARAKRGI